VTEPVEAALTCRVGLDVSDDDGLGDGMEYILAGLTNQVFAELRRDALSTIPRPDRLSAVRLITQYRDLDPFAGCTFVPTMGALHAGHRRLVELAVQRSRASGRAAIVSVFVNPTQFNDPRDLERYPRTLEADFELCRDAGAAALYAPTADEVYPPGLKIAPPPLPSVATRPGLEDAHRPGHFAGVCQVVRRLFDLVRPGEAVFGEKDWQQLQVIRAMTDQQNLGVRIVPVETVRETDSLAMSSRNVFLSPENRLRARSLSAALCAACGERSPPAAEAHMREVLLSAGVEVEYAVIRDADSLMPLAADSRSGRALIAARAGSVRLIDNAPWHAPG